MARYSTTKPSEASEFPPSSGENKVATVCGYGTICIFDSRSGGQLVHLDAVIPRSSSIGVMWLNDRQQILTAICRG